MVLSDGEVVNFADCHHGVTFSSGPLRWAAEKLGAEETRKLVSQPARRGGVPTGGAEIVLSGEPTSFEPSGDAWLPDLQVLIARGAGSPSEQLILAAKGGHNGEWHNHNDVGTFIVHWRGESLVCDLGAPLYTKKTFSPQRYELLATRSLGHNVPLLNETEQVEGAEHAAEVLACEVEKDTARFSLQIAGAYPEGASLESLVRTLELRRGDAECVELTDEVRFGGAAGSYRLPLYTKGRFEIVADGCVRAVGERGALRIEFDPQSLTAELEEVEHGDGALEQQFGPTLTRCMFALRESAEQAEVRLRFTPAGNAQVTA